MTDEHDIDIPEIVDEDDAQEPAPEPAGFRAVIRCQTGKRSDYSPSAAGFVLHHGEVYTEFRRMVRRRTEDGGVLPRREEVVPANRATVEAIAKLFNDKLGAGTVEFVEV